MTDFAAGTVSNADATVTINVITKVAEDFPKIQTKSITPVGLAGDLFMWESRKADESHYITTTYTQKGVNSEQIRNQLDAMAGTIVTFNVQDANAAPDQIFAKVIKINTVNKFGIGNGDNDTMTIANWELKVLQLNQTTQVPSNLA